MKYIIYFVLLLLQGERQNISAQGKATVGKEVIDSLAIQHWPYLRFSPAISNDGNYFLCFIDNMPATSNTLLIKALHSQWQRAHTGISKATFSGDSRHVIYQHSDTLFFEALGSNQVQSLPGVISFQQSEMGGRWLAYQLKGDTKELVLLDLFTGQEQLRLKDVTGYLLDRSGSILLIKTALKQDSVILQTIQWMDLEEGKSAIVWSIRSPAALVKIIDWKLDAANKQLVFVTDNKETAASKSPDRSIWYYTPGLLSAVQLVNSYSPGIEPGLGIEGIVSFSQNSQWLLFNLQEVAEVRKPDPSLSKVTIWSYKDQQLPPDQLAQLQNGPKNYLASVNVKGGPVIRLQKENEDRNIVLSKNYAVISEHFVEPWWQFAPQPVAHLVSLKDGSRLLVKKMGQQFSNFSFSPEEHWLLYFDLKTLAYHSFELSTGKVRNITGAIPARFESEYVRGTMPDAVAPVAGWLPGDAGVLLYDNYDLWQVDPSGKTTAVNVTNRYGQRHQFKLRLLDRSGSTNTQFIVKPGDTLLLTAFSPINKYNGFCQKVLGAKGNPAIGYLGPYLFYRVESQKAHYYAFSDGMQPLKAADNRVWIVKRQSAIEAPNYFWTTDFKTYQALTDIQPQRYYNWLHSELVTWRQLDGTMSQGVLYKPENFDPAKKYPLIFNYYEQLSHRLYESPIPEYTSTNINIPWFVSRGYLVFTPDIHYQVATRSGKTTGEWAYNSIVSAAQMLMKLPYVDGTSLGIQGHSFGGGETNYLVTHTHLFAAAAEVAGDSDPISGYLTLVPAFATIEHVSKEYIREYGQGRFGASPWQRPDLYRKASAVLSADQVTTPILIMHNEKDNSVQWRQGIELYMALRRLGKKVWMLQYENGGHGVFGKDAMDYTIRLTQFFDYYLKRKQVPMWMNESMPLKLRGIETGYRLKDKGIIP